MSNQTSDNNVNSEEYITSYTLYTDVVSASNMITKIINEIKGNCWVLRSIIPTIYFNFHYLPFRQAIKLPIILYKPHLKLMKGL